MAATMLTIGEIDTLRSIIGKKIESYEGVALGPGDYYGAIRLNTHSSAIDISNFYEKTDVAFERGMGLEDVGTMRVSYAKGPLNLDGIVSSPPLTVIPVNRKVHGIEVVNDTVDMLANSKVTNSFTFTQAIVMQLEKGFFVIDRNVWFEVFLSACVTNDPKRFLRDTERDWVDGCAGSQYAAVVKREVIAL